MKSLWLWGILAVAIAGRLGLLNATARSPAGAFTPDSQGYWELSGRLLAEGRFGPADSPEIFRTPGYPVFLLIGQSETEVGDGWRAVLAVQVLLDVLLVLVTYWFGRLVASRPAALLAALFQAISPLAVASGCRVLSDSLFAFGFTLAVLLMVGHLRTGLWWPLIVSAVVLAGACYVRPVGLVMAGVFVAVLLFRPRRLARAGVLAGIVIACVAPWVVRNIVVADYYGFSTFAADSMYRFSAAAVVAETEGLSPAAARARMDADAERAAPDAHERTPGQGARYRRRRAREIVLGHPWTYAKLHLTGSVGVWLPGAIHVLEVAGLTTHGRGTLDVLHDRGPIAAARHYFDGNTTAIALAVPMVLVLAGQYLGVGLCLVRKLRLRMSATAWLILLVVVVMALLPGPAATPRFRIAVNPLLSLAAGVGLVALRGWIGARRPRRR